MAENIVEDAVGRNNLLNRLSALQNLCSDDDSNYPKALLFVAGQDGKGNKGSISIIKYLLLGSVAKDLYDETLDAQYEPLEEIVLLIKHSSVSVLWSHEMKRLLSPVFNHIPMLVEYLSTTEEESEIDLYQARKCTDFKRMILNSLEVGDGVGVPVPLGYSDITDIESWPLLQSFAIDTVYCPTGFFTSRYTIMDLTAPLFSGLYQCVDGCYVDNAIETTQKTIVSHVLQTLALLGCSGAGSTADKRSKVTAEEAAGPLDLLFDFGELHAVHAADPMSRPAVLFGKDTALLGVTAGSASDAEAWQDTSAGNSLHCVVEGCEPSTGMRFCRTYLLQRGKAIPMLSVLDSLVDEVEGRRGEEKTSGAHDMVPVAVTSALQRLEALYVKLWLSLRYCVKYAFLTNVDVLEAGQDIQRYMDVIMNGSIDDKDQDDDGSEIPQECRRGYAEMIQSFSSIDLARVHLLATEQLQVHMDCMTGLGQLAAIEDVDDMGGGCWSYIRVSIHGVSLPRGEGAVAVGDTFLFSPLTTKGNPSISSKLRISGASAQTVDACFLGKSENGHTAVPLLGDGVCVTHSVPYYRCLTGQGAEETSAQRLLSCCKSTHYLAHLGLGCQLDYSGTGLLTLPLLTDHPVVPVVDAEIRIYSEGLLIERMDSCSSLPVLISIGAHVQCLWVVDSAEVSLQASWLLPPMLSTFPAVLPEHCPEGKLIVLQLKSDADLREEREREDEEDLKSVLQHNLLARALPFTSADSQPRFAAVFVPARARSSQAMSTALASWHVAARRHDVTVFRGADKSVPAGILTAFLTAVDRWAVSGLTGGGTGNDSLQAASGADSGTGISIVGECSSDTLVTTAQYCVQNPCIQIPVVSRLSLRYMHSLSEAQRLALNNSSPGTLNAVAGLTPLYRSTKRNLCVIMGMGGSGTAAVSTQLVAQLPGKLQESSSISLIRIDLADMFERCPSKRSVMDSQYVDTYLNDAISDATVEAPLLPVVVLDLSLSAMHSISSVATLHQMIADKLSARIQVVVSVVSTACLQLGGLQSPSESNYCREEYLTSKYGMGQEQWQALSLQLLRPSLCDVCVAVDHPTSAFSANSYPLLRQYLSRVNPAASLLRLTSSSRLRLDGEGIDLIAARVSFPPPSSTATNTTANVTIPVGLSSRDARQLSEGYEMASSAEMSGIYPSLKIVSCGATAVAEAERPNAGGVRRVQVFRVSPLLLNTGKAGWNLNLVLRILQLLLPQATIYNQSLCDDCWVPPPLTKASESKMGEDGLPRTRLVQLATAKVMAARQTREGAAIYTQRLEALIKRERDREPVKDKAKAKTDRKSRRKNDSDDQKDAPKSNKTLPQSLQSLVAGIKSISGTIQRGAGGAPGLVLSSGSSTATTVAISDSASAVQVLSVEACHGMISLKEGSASAPASVLIEGVFDEDDRNLLHELFSLCTQHHLSPKPPLSPAEIDPLQQTALQHKELAAVAGRRQKTGESSPADENSGGWWFDGQSFVDVHGARSDVQPTTIGRLVDQHVKEQNRQRAVYNSMLDYCQ